MIPLVIFYAHIVAVAAVFSRRYQEEGLVEGLLAVFFMSLLFFVGWTISGFIVTLALGPEGLTRFLDRDALSLVLLTAGEVVFYYFFTRDARIARRRRRSAGTSQPL